MRMMETLGLENLCVTDICGRMTLDAIGIAGFGRTIQQVFMMRSIAANTYIPIQDSTLSASRW